MSSMKLYCPSYILLCSRTPLDQCLCDRCENVEQLIKTLLALGVKEVPGNRYSAIDRVVCNERLPQIGSDYTFPKKECLTGACEECGEHKLETLVKNGNVQSFRENKMISWHKWFKGTGKVSHEKCQMKGTLTQALQELLQMIRTLKTHIFRANWHRSIFDYSCRNLERGHVVQIFDFAMNYRNMYQDEVQSAYWSGTQTSIHAVINYFLCTNSGCNEKVTLILAQISDEKLHDSFLARAGHNLAFNYLAQLRIPMDLIMQFCDNCSSQYKSRCPFAELARCPLDIIRVYFGEKHGKSHCDGFFGRLKAWVTYKIKA